LSLRERSDRQGERVRAVRFSRRPPCPRPCDGLRRLKCPTLIRPLRGYPSSDRMRSFVDPPGEGRGRAAPLPLGEGLSLRERSDRQGERVRAVRLSRRQPCPRPCDGFADGQARPSSVRFAATFSHREKEGEGRRPSPVGRGLERTAASAAVLAQKGEGRAPQSAPAVSPSVRRLRRRTGPTLIRPLRGMVFSHREKEDEICRSSCSQLLPQHKNHIGLANA